MSRRRTNTEWRAVKESFDRLKYRHATEALGAARKPRDLGLAYAMHFQPPGVGAPVGPVTVYHPDGTVREIVSATEWRRRHGNPFRGKKSQGEIEDARQR